VIEKRQLMAFALRTFGEMNALMGQAAEGPQAVIRRENAVGAGVAGMEDNPWFHSVTVPLGQTPPMDEPGLPSCVWTAESAVDGRVEAPDIATPCMGMELRGLQEPRMLPAGYAFGEVDMRTLGELNEAAYEQEAGSFTPLIANVSDARVDALGIVYEGTFVCAGLCLRIDGDAGIHFVATAAAHQKRGLASALVLALLQRAKAAGCTTTSLQASPDGLPVWQKLGFVQVGMMRVFLREV